MTHQDYSSAPEKYIRAFLLIQRDLQELFDYVEPADINLDCYSYRIHELLMRTCIEIEANCKAILKENKYTKSNNWGMGDYKKINHTHLLSSYVIELPAWDGEKNVREPFQAWEDNKSLEWYKAYNNAKHDRHNNFSQASFNNLIDAISGLVVILSSQFHTNDFSPNSDCMTYTRGDGMESAIGNYFLVKFPNEWSSDMCYDFNWPELTKKTTIFHKFDYDNI